MKKKLIALCLSSIFLSSLGMESEDEMDFEKICSRGDAREQSSSIAVEIGSPPPHIDLPIERDSIDFMKDSPERQAALNTILKNSFNEPDTPDLPETPMSKITLSTRFSTDNAHHDHEDSNIVEIHISASATPQNPPRKLTLSTNSNDPKSSTPKPNNAYENSSEDFCSKEATAHVLLVAITSHEDELNRIKEPQNIKPLSLDPATHCEPNSLKRTQSAPVGSKNKKSLLVKPSNLVTAASAAAASQNLPPRGPGNTSPSTTAAIKEIDETLNQKTQTRINALEVEEPKKTTSSFWCCFKRCKKNAKGGTKEETE